MPLVHVDVEVVSSQRHKQMKKHIPVDPSHKRQNVTDLKVPEAAKKANQLVRENPGFFHVIIVDNWRGLRLIFDSEASAACNNDCDQCRHSRLFTPSQKKGRDLKATLFEFITTVDKKLYGPELYLPCKTTRRYAECFVSYLLDDPVLCKRGLPQNKMKRLLQKEMKLVRDFVVVFNDGVLPNDELARGLKRKIVSEALIQLDKKYRRRAEMLRAVLKELGWDFGSQVFR
jgi:hypothetical protein